METQKQFLRIVIIPFITLVLFIIVISFIVWGVLSVYEQNALLNILIEHSDLMIILLLIIIILALIILCIFFQYYIMPLYILSEETSLIYAANPNHRIIKSYDGLSEYANRSLVVLLIAVVNLLIFSNVLFFLAD